MILLSKVPNVVGSREGWELYIVTGGVMVGILLSDILTITPPFIQLPFVGFSLTNLYPS
jgi:hypothetical protein